MRLKVSHIRYIADKIARDLVNANYVEILTSDKDIIKVASKYLEDNINKELAIEERAKHFVDENIDMVSLSSRGTLVGFNPVISYSILIIVGSS